MSESNPQNPPQTTDAGVARRLKIFVACVAAALLAGFLIVHFLRARDEHRLERETMAQATAAPVVDVTVAGNGPVSMALTLPGQTAAWFQSTIYARIDGYVGNWTADIGDHVKKGQILATLDSPDLDAQLAAARAKVKAAEALVEFSKSTNERWKNSPNGVVSVQEREAKRADYDSAEAQLGLDQADVDRYLALTQFKQVTAPYSGVIIERHIDIGNLVTAGSTSSTTALYRIVQDDPIRVFVDVPQSAAQFMQNGMAAHISASNLPGKTFAGKLTRTANAIDEQTRTLRVEVDIPNSKHELVSGMYVNVSFAVPNTELIEVPASALIFRASGPQVAVVKDGKIDFREVTIARDFGNSVEISSGLVVGEKVALNFGNQGTQGEAVVAQDVADAGASNAQK
jgi:RND family efflux transporter MFP subunit